METMVMKNTISLLKDFKKDYFHESVALALPELVSVNAVLWGGKSIGYFTEARL